MKHSVYRVSVAFLFAGVFLSSCLKDGGNCLSPSGPIITQDRHVADFDSIRMLDNVDVVLLQDSVNRVRVEAGENIIGGIRTDIAGRELIIANNNVCNWLRSYSAPIRVYVSVKNLLKIHYNSSGDISCPDTIRTGYFKIEMWGGCGNIGLKLVTDDGYFIQYIGTATLKASGTCKISNVHASDYGLLHLGNLRTGYTFVTNNSTNDCYVNAVHDLDATISSIGNIYYKGEPEAINLTVTGTGKLIRY